MVVVGVRLWDSERSLWRFQTCFQNSAYSASLWGVVFFFLNWLTRVVSSVISGFQKRKHDFFKCEYCLSKWDNIYDNLSSLSCTNQ